ncbi:hypothetical protein T05_12082 [Trichinella murrelli]|uniref:Uncharacterized protein n=1 Tax=Trichinella murrelli TaxID=144512 RepID=A0A0V0TWM0_9BILA|nr:hypothetical protein T05_12082 [Trichinella murrelli]
MDKRCGVQIKAALSASRESNLSSENALSKWTDGQTNGQSGVQPKRDLTLGRNRCFNVGSSMGKTKRERKVCLLEKYNECPDEIFIACLFCEICKPIVVNYSM